MQPYPKVLKKWVRNEKGADNIKNNNRDKYEAGALFVHEKEERQNKHNQKPKERSSQEFDHKEAQMVICCV